jgi:hypothetical protein
VAKYLARFIFDPKIKKIVEKLSKQLHHDDAVNILINLAYLSQDPIILNSVISSSSVIFSGSPEFDILSSSSEILNLVSDSSTFAIEPGTIKQRREELLTQKDDTDELIDNKDELFVDDEKEIEDLNEVLKINVAFKTIQILGQIIKNAPDSLENVEKSRIAQESFSLGLRLLGFLVNNIIENKEAIIKYLLDFMLEKHPKWTEDKIVNNIKNTLFYLAEGISFATIKHISDSIGHEDLSITFEKIIANQENLSYQLINININLYNYKNFPKGLIERTYSLVVQNRYAVQLLRHIVWYYLSIIPVNDQLLRSICTKIGIDIQLQASLRDPRSKLLPN